MQGEKRDWVRQGRRGTSRAGTRNRAGYRMTRGASSTQEERPSGSEMGRGEVGEGGRRDKRGTEQGDDTGGQRLSWGWGCRRLKKPRWKMRQGEEQACSGGRGRCRDGRAVTLGPAFTRTRSCCPGTARTGCPRALTSLLVQGEERGRVSQDDVVGHLPIQPLVLVVRRDAQHGGAGHALSADAGSVLQRVEHRPVVIDVLQKNLHVHHGVQATLRKGQVRDGAKSGGQDRAPLRRARPAALCPTASPALTPSTAVMVKS